MGKMFFNMLATFAEFEVDFLSMRTREGMAVARSRGRLKGKQPKLPRPASRPSWSACTAPASTPLLTSWRSSSVGRATVYRVRSTAPRQRYTETPR